MRTDFLIARSRKRQLIWLRRAKGSRTVPDGLREISSTEGALCDRFLLLSFVKFRVIRAEMNKLNTCES